MRHLLALAGILAFTLLFVGYHYAPAGPWHIYAAGALAAVGTILIMRWGKPRLRKNSPAEEDEPPIYGEVPNLPDSLRVPKNEPAAPTLRSLAEIEGDLDRGGSKAPIRTRGPRWRRR